VAEAQVRERSGVSIVAVIQGDDIQVNPDPLVPLPDEAEILLIGSEDAEAGFLDIFAHA
jgi:K+/H+ antiporter YhaU regulatory subunit KhtT